MWMILKITKRKDKNKKRNYIIRTKRDKGSVKSLLNRLAYHDFYLLSEFLI